MKKSLTARIARCSFAGVVFLTVPILHAGITGHPKPAIVPPQPEPLELTYSVLSRAWWLTDFSLPVPVNPTFTAGADCATGQPRLLVWFLYAGPASVSCVVPAERFLFFPIADSECSNLEAPPFFGATAAARAACAKAWTDHVTNLSATIDGVPVPHPEQYRVQTGDFPFSVPDNNILTGSGPASGHSSADGFYLLLTPLTPGRTHTIHVTGTFHDPTDPAQASTIDTVITVTIGH